MLDAAIIILNFRTPEMTAQCLGSLSWQMVPGRIETIVVDNDSGDGSVEAIETTIAERSYRWARVVRSGRNGGFAYGNNVGFRAVEAHAYILLNSDAIVRPGAIDELLDAMRSHPEAGLIGPRFEDHRGRTDISTFRMLHPLSELLRAADTGPLSRLLPHYVTPIMAGHEPLEPDWLGFACVLLPRRVVRQVGPLDEGFFMYFEDIDYSRRVREAGHTILYWPKARVLHLQGGSSQFSAGSNQAKRAPRYFYESRARYFAKYHGAAGPLYANLSFLAGHAVSSARRLVGQRREPRRERELRDIWIDVLHPLTSTHDRNQKGAA